MSQLISEEWEDTPMDGLAGELEKIAKHAATRPTQEADFSLELEAAVLGTVPRQKQRSRWLRQLAKLFGKRQT